MTDPLLQALLKKLAIKRSVFISYHHDSDQWYYDEFARLFADAYDCIRDNSLARAVDSDDPEYVSRRIRENYITGSSCTIVLCGPQTRWRKYVDWEIKATLDKEHGLVGVLLPNNPIDVFGGTHTPDRLQDNLRSGYAGWITWTELVAGGAVRLKAVVEAAIGAAKAWIRNSREMRRRNG